LSEGLNNEREYETINASSLSLLTNFKSLNSPLLFPPDSDLTHYVGSRWYRSPELLGNSTTYTTTCDIWSCGCILAELSTGSALFQGDDEKEVLEGILGVTGQVGDEAIGVKRGLRQRGVMSEELYYKDDADVKTRDLKVELRKLGNGGVSLIYEMLVVDSKKRPAAKDCLESKFFIEEDDVIFVDEEEKREEEEEEYKDDHDEYEDEDEFEEEEEKGEDFDVVEPKKEQLTG